MARNVVNIEEVSKAFDIKELLIGVSLGVSEGDRIGIVGRNGSGKSTLMKIIAGVETPDSGRVTKSNSARIGLLSQVDSANPESTVGEVVLGDTAKHEWASEPNIREVIAFPKTGEGRDLMMDSPSAIEQKRSPLTLLVHNDCSQYSVWLTASILLFPYKIKISLLSKRIKHCWCKYWMLLYL
ncbi:MAG: hypothetical protein RI916_961, partial [Actinomycetota bacterium]